MPSSSAISGSNSSLSRTSFRISQQLPNLPSAMPSVPSGYCKLLGRLRQLLGLGDRLFDGADHVERLLRQVVVIAVAQALEALDGVGDRHELAGRTREHLGDVERL